MTKHQYKQAFRAYRQMLHTVDWSDPSTYITPQEFGIAVTRPSEGYTWLLRGPFMKWGCRLALACIKRRMEDAECLQKEW